MWFYFGLWFSLCRMDTEKKQHKKTAMQKSKKNANLRGNERIQKQTSKY